MSSSLHGRSNKRRRDEHSQSSSPPTRNIPVSLGKPSLRLRLEAYYSLISPDIIADETAWRKRFEQIYDKFGGTVEGEAKLGAKLAKKYGNNVRLLLTTSAGGGWSGGVVGDAGTSAASATAESGVSKQDEEWYNLTSNEEGSGDISFVSSCFDPYATLSADMTAVVRANPFVSDAPIIDNVSKFRRLLPPQDPQHLVPPRRKPTHHHGAAAAATAAATMAVPKIPIPGAFTALADRFDRGPFALLRSIHAQKQRVRIMVRYVDCIRGTLTGYILAFDKHMNMILRDVDEVYSGRATKSYNEADDNDIDTDTYESKPSNLEVEVKRRTCFTDGRQRKGKQGHTSHVTLKRRHCQQLLVRGDNVVMVWRADDERSSFPPSANQNVASIYAGTRRETEDNEQENNKDGGKIPSAGFLMAAMAWQKHQKRGGGGGGGRNKFSCRRQQGR